MDELLTHLSTADDGHLETKMAIRVKELVGKDNETKIKDLRQIIYECAYGSLASDFVMKALHVVYHTIAGHWASLHILRYMGKPGDSYIDENEQIHIVDG